MMLKRGARGGRETKRLDQRGAALTCARGPDVSARWCDRGRLGALSKARRAPRATRMGAARKGVRWRCARWLVDCSEARACGVAAKGLQALPMVLQAGLCVSRRAAERCQLSGASCRCAGDALGDQDCAASAAAARGAAQARAACGSDCAWHRAASQRQPMRCQRARELGTIAWRRKGVARRRTSRGVFLGAGNGCASGLEFWRARVLE